MLFLVECRWAAMQKLLFIQSHYSNGIGKFYVMKMKITSCITFVYSLSSNTENDCPFEWFCLCCVGCCFYSSLFCFGPFLKLQNAYVMENNLFKDLHLQLKRCFSFRMVWKWIEIVEWRSTTYNNEHTTNDSQSNDSQFWNSNTLW